MSTVDRFRKAVETQDLAALPELFTPDVRFFSPVKFTPFEGVEMVEGLLRVLLRTFEDFRYVGQFEGTAEMGADVRTVESHILIFRTLVNGKQVHGIDLLQLDEDDRIKEFTVMIRPMSAVTAVSEAVFAGLVAEGLLPVPGM